MSSRTHEARAAARRSLRDPTDVPAPQKPGRPCSVRSRATQQQQPAGEAAGMPTRLGDGPREPHAAQWRGTLAEAFSVLPATLAGASIAVYLAWRGEEMGSRVPRGHGLLLGILGCVVVSIAAVVLASGQTEAKPARRRPGLGLMRLDHDRPRAESAPRRQTGSAEPVEVRVRTNRRGLPWGARLAA